MNEKNPNKQLYILENKDITWEYDKHSLYEKILGVLNGLKENGKMNLDTKKSREIIASVIVEEL